MLKNKKRLIIVVILVGIAAVLLAFGPKTLAMFRSEKNGNVNLKLAEWNVEVNKTSQEDSIDLVSGVTNQSYTLKVKNISEVDIDYKIIINNLPTGVEVSLDGGNFQIPDNGTIIFENVDKILYTDNSKEKSHTLEFKSNVGTEEVSNREINIKVIAKQKL